MWKAFLIHIPVKEALSRGGEGWWRPLKLTVPHGKRTRKEICSFNISKRKPTQSYGWNKWVNIPPFVPTENKHPEQRKQTVLEHNKTHMHRFEYSRKNKGGAETYTCAQIACKKGEQTTGQSLHVCPWWPEENLPPLLLGTFFKTL